MSSKRSFSIYNVQIVDKWTNRLAEAGITATDEARKYLDENWPKWKNHMVLFPNPNNRDEFILIGKGF